MAHIAVRYVVKRVRRLPWAPRPKTEKGGL